MQNVIAIDTEFFQHYGNLHRPGGKFACLSVTDGLGVLTNNSLSADEAESLKYLLALKKFDGVIALQNAIYDIRQLIHNGIWPVGWEPAVWDTMMVEQDLFGGWYQSFSLQALARRHLAIYLEKDIRNEFVDATELTSDMEQYAIQDANITREIALAQQRIVYNEYANEFPWYWEIDQPAMWAVMNMKPIRMDVDGWIANAEALLEEGHRIQEELGFNVKSQPQVQAALKAAGIKKIRKDSSCDQESLEGWLKGANEHQTALIKGILRARHCRDAYAKYGPKFVATNVEEGNLIYPNWKTTGPETSRMACSDPNMMNIPKKDEGLRYRAYFLAGPGNELLVVDQNQQEPCYSAQLSRDRALRQEIIDGVDLHQVHADLFKVNRHRGKKINLSLNYGKSAWGLAAEHNLELEEVEEGLRARRQHYPEYHAWMDRQKRQAERLNYVNTVMGRRVWTNPYSYQAPNNAINSPVQGSAAEHAKLALVYTRELCKAKGLEFLVNIMVHDEMVLDVPKGLIPQYKEIVTEAWLEAGHKLMPNVPTKLVIKTGPNWRDLVA